MYGTQAVSGTEMDYTVFENDVKMYGTQACNQCDRVIGCLRMM